ncbi:MAG: hypothetical protein OXD01_00575 [Gammaproteobacteria bacterium]|nr:hypothetical protein [Gammaproteobacteria bacterium]
MYHQKQHQTDVHLFISVIACQAIQLLRQRKEPADIHNSWTTVREVLGPLQRTTYLRRDDDDGKTLHLRKPPSLMHTVGTLSGGATPATSKGYP